MLNDTQGFDIDVQQELAEQDDNTVNVHVEGVDGAKMYFERDGEEHPVVITVVGAHSKQYRNAESRLRKRKLKSMRNAEFIYEDTMEKAVACTVGWDGFFSKGSPVPFSGFNVRRIYERCPWLLDLVTDAIHDNERFFKKD